MPYCTLPDKTKLYFEIYGSELDLSKSEARIKPTIIASHGGPAGDHTFHAPFFELLAKDAQVILYDHRGCGRSDGDNPDEWNLQQWAKDLHDFCQALSIKNLYIAGISFGGWVAMQYGVLYPNAYKGLILIDTEAFFDINTKMDDYEEVAGPEIREIVYNCYTNPTIENKRCFAKECVPLFTKKPFPAELYQHCLIRDNLDKHFKLNVAPKYNLINCLSVVTACVLYISGTTNPHHSANSAKRSVEAFTKTNVELHLLDGIGFTTTDNPELVAEIVTSFINDK
ncbi:MAG: alpha/beta hydrolase [Gammaproteobacteria bacterium]|nr:alpha/beta hydrolase [Gammaproteobacteria bacterium]